jgi:hypothetical protein
MKFWVISTFLTFTSDAEVKSKKNGQILKMQCHES